MAAAFAVFAILIQALLPAAAQAAQRGGQTIVVCAVDGSHAVRALALPGHAQKKFAGLPCPDCLTAAVAVVLTEPPLLAPAALVYAASTYHPGAAVRLAFARAPPRPYGQGPPTA